MIFKKEYRFPFEKYDQDGTNTFNGEFFLDFLKACESDFHAENPLVFANYLFGNASTMHLLQHSFFVDADEYFGMELINDTIDFDTALEIDKYSNTKTVYAIESYADDNEEAPLFLIIDDDIKDGRFELRYLPDDDDENEDCAEPSPVNSMQMK